MSKTTKKTCVHCNKQKEFSGDVVPRTYSCSYCLVYIAKRKFVIEDNLLAFKCPGCRRYHTVDVTRWDFNGCVEEPTITPSVKITCPPSDFCCHFFLKNGEFQFCNDCSHEHKGETLCL